MARGLLAAVVLVVATAGCAAPGPEATVPVLHPLPESMLREPGAHEGILLSPRSPRVAAVGELHRFEVGHCGLFSPIDFDGNLWRPVAGQSGAGRPLTEDIPEGPAIITLLETNVALLTASNGALVRLERHEGERAYFGCM